MPEAKAIAVITAFIPCLWGGLYSATVMVVVPPTLNLVCLSGRYASCNVKESSFRPTGTHRWLAPGLFSLQRCFSLVVGGFWSADRSSPPPSSFWPWLPMIAFSPCLRPFGGEAFILWSAFKRRRSWDECRDRSVHNGWRYLVVKDGRSKRKKAHRLVSSDRYHFFSLGAWGYLL